MSGMTFRVTPDRHLEKKKRGRGKMERKMVFFDLDGTLLNEDKQIQPAVMNAVHQLTENGVLVGIATGRAPFLIEDTRRKLGIDTSITFNGQYVVQGENVIYKNPLEFQQLQELEQAAKTNGHPMVFLAPSEMKANKGEDPNIAKSLGDLKAEYPPVDPVFYHGRDIYQALLFCHSPEEGLYEGKQTDFQFIRWHDVSVDVLPAIGSKALGIERILHRVGVKRENTYAFGDGLNDIEMLRFVGTGVAMGNAFEATKKAADWVTDDVSNDGVVRGLETLKLIG